jgi:hypothetical protein
MRFDAPADILGSDSNIFIKLPKDGDSIRGVFRGNPFHFRQHWKNKKSTVCKGKDCPECAIGIDSVFRFRINFITFENTEYVVKVFEQSKKVYLSLKTLQEDGYNLEQTPVKITRQGVDQQTNYLISPVPLKDNETAVQRSAGIEKVMGAMRLHDLQNLDKEKPAQGIQPGDFESDIPY